ncbi:MAG: inosine/xanthosine triphosphatase [Candidatus Aenigmarchaeota archaeon]|nr:inosine/xanthosine triphosphatase [Candidatus Aenigmarchaeota archaeon]
MKILVGSTNPVKIAAAREVFSRYFGEVQAEGVSVASQVDDQPLGDDTFLGAENRAKALLRLNGEQGLGADYCVGIEGGIVQRHGQWFGFGAMCILDRHGRRGYGASPHFPLPAAMVQGLLRGEELGAVTDQLFNEENSKQKMGAVGILTRGKMDRQALYEAGLTVALAPFVSQAVYFPGGARTDGALK